MGPLVRTHTIRFRMLASEYPYTIPRGNRLARYPNAIRQDGNNTPLDDQMTQRTTRRKQKRGSNAIHSPTEDLLKVRNDISHETSQRRPLSTRIRRGYVVLGIIVISIGICMPSYLFYETLIPVTTVLSSSEPPPPSTACTVVTVTFTEANGTTHRHYDVTCSETLHISSIPNNATLTPVVQGLVSNLSYIASVVSTIATVAVALATMPFQGEGYARLRGSLALPLVATCFLSMAVVLALFLILAQPLSVVSPTYALCVMLFMLGSTLLGFGFSIVSWGSLEAVDHGKNTVSVRHE